MEQNAYLNFLEKEAKPNKKPSERYLRKSKQQAEKKKKQR